MPFPADWKVFCDNLTCGNTYAHLHGANCEETCECKEKKEPVNIEEGDTESNHEVARLKVQLSDERNAKEKALRERDGFERINKEMDRLTKSQDTQIRQKQVSLNELYEVNRKLRDKLRKAKRAIKNLSGAWK